MNGNKMNLNCFYSIFVKKRNSHGHFKYIKNIKLYLRIVVSVLSLCVHPKKFLSMILNLNCFYSIFAKKRNSHSHFKYIKNIKLYLGIVVSVLSLCIHPVSVDLRVSRISAIQRHLHHLEGRLLVPAARLASAVCPPNNGDAARWH